MKDIDILALQLIFKTSKTREICNLIYTTPEIMICSVRELFELCQKKLNPAIKFSDVEQAYIKASTIIAQTNSLGIKVLVPTSPYFPALLKEIKSQVSLLFVKGAVEVLQGTMVAVVGTRNPSLFGAETAYKFSERLAQQNIVVVSGLAEGIDRQAHLGCLNAKGKTIAVLAHGLDMIYPAKHKELAEKILQTGGCLISEYPPQTKPQKYTFVQRNRIQSGLSVGVIVVESSASGGTMHTANFCLEQRRWLACLDFTAQANQPDGNAVLLQTKGAFRLRELSDLNSYVEQIRQKYLLIPERIVLTEQLGSNRMIDASELKMKPEQSQSNMFLVPNYSQYFMGRQKYLEHIDRIVGVPSIHTKYPKIILVGMGGVGKTELAIKYAWNNRHLYPGGCFFIDAEHIQYIQEAFNSIKRAFGLSIDALSEKNELFNFLCGVGRTLLIYDNVDHSQVEDLKDFSPEDGKGFSSANFTVLLTSRDQIKVADFGERILIDPDDLNMQDDALDFVNEKFPDNPANKLLVTRLQYLPLALSQAVSYLRQHPTVTIEEYCEQLEQIEKKSEFLSYIPLEKRKEKLQVLNTWLLSLESLKRTMPKAIEILHICAFLYANNIDKNWFIKQYNNIDDLLPYLFNYSLLYSERFQRNCFKIHRLIQEVVMITIRGAEIDYIKRGLSCMATVNKPYCRDNAINYAAIAPHVQALIDNISPSYKGEYLVFNIEMAQMFINVGLYYKDQLLAFKSAEFYLELAHNILLARNSVGEEINLELLSQVKLHLLKIYIGNNKLDVAEQIFSQLEEQMQLTTQQYVELLFAKTQFLRKNKEFAESLQFSETLLVYPSLEISQKARCFHDLVLTCEQQYEYNKGIITNREQQMSSLPAWKTIIKDKIMREIEQIENANAILFKKICEYFKQCVELQKQLGNILEVARIYILFLKFNVKYTKIEPRVILTHSLELYELCAQYLREQKSPYYFKMIELLCKIFSSISTEEKWLHDRLNEYLNRSLVDFKQNVVQYGRLQTLRKVKQSAISSYFKSSSVLITTLALQSHGTEQTDLVRGGTHKRKTPDYP